MLTTLKVPVSYCAPGLSLCILCTVSFTHVSICHIHATSAEFNQSSTYIGKWAMLYSNTQNVQRVMCFIKFLSIEKNLYWVHKLQ